ncbi:MAG: ribokinase, partial [Desulfobulbaceae bacterium]|mgnify:CR=1 FL=1
MARIVCVGLACLDYLFKVADLPAGGGKFFAENYVAAPGGPAAAASIGVATLGHEAIFLGRLGDDQVGKDLINRLSDRGVDASNVRLVGGQSSQVSAVIVDHDGERQIINYSSKLLDPDPSWLPAEIIRGADFLLVDVRWPEGAEAALKIAREGKVPSLLDADIAPVDTSTLVMSADYVVFSERGLQMFSGESDLDKGLVKAGTKADGWLAVTAGERGGFWLDDHNILQSSPAPQIEAIDTCGAGDIFHGAFAVAKAEQMDNQLAMRFASVAASLKCLTFGGSLGAPDRNAVGSLLSGMG